MTKVLLYSGGLDSWALAQIEQPEVLLHVDMATRYGDVESDNLDVPKGVRGSLVVASLPLSQWERSDAIIPGRNAHLVLVAANYADTILIGATAGDRVHDKDPVFAERMNALLQHMYSPQWWIPQGRTVRVELPAKEWSKRELVARYLAAGGDPETIATRTISCYNATPEVLHCGRCKPCARKWIALVCNNIEVPFDASEFVESTYVPLIRNGGWDRGYREAHDVMTAMRKVR